MEELNLERVKQYGFKNSDITAYAEAFLPDEQNDGEFDEFMSETVQDIADDLGKRYLGPSFNDADPNIYPTKEVEELMWDRSQTVKQAIVSYLEGQINYIEEHKDSKQLFHVTVAPLEN